MLCETAREHLHALSDGEQLKTRRQLALTLRHCLTCKDCRTYRRHLQQLTRTTRHLPVALPAGLRQRVLSQLPAPAANAQTIAGTHTSHLHRREIAMFKRLTSITGAVLLAALAATITAKRTPRETVRYEPNVRAEDARSRGQTLDEAMAEAVRRWNVLDAQIRKQNADAARTRTQHTTRQYAVTEIILRELAERDGPAKIAKAKQLRDSLHDWAILHRSELRQMLRASGTDQAALMRVYNVLPHGLAFVSAGERITPSNADLLTVQDLPPGYMHFDMLIMENWRHRPYMTDPMVRDEFALWHDIKVAYMVDNAKVQYAVWASGRITVTTPTVPAFPRARRPVASHYEATLMGERIQEADDKINIVYPPYEELLR